MELIKFRSYEPSFTEQDYVNLKIEGGDGIDYNNLEFRVVFLGFRANEIDKIISYDPTRCLVFRLSGEVHLAHVPFRELFPRWQNLLRLEAMQNDAQEIEQSTNEELKKEEEDESPE